MATLNFNQDQCILCGQCVEKCPFGALEILDNKIEINASCKMCKLCVKSCPVQAVSLVEDAVKQTVDKDAWKGVMVFVEQEESGIHPVAFELIGKARELAAKINHPVYAVLIGGGQAKEQAQTLLEYGVDKVYVYAHEALAHFRGDVYTNIMEDCIKTVKPTVILVGATSLGRSLAPACATRFRTGLTADCTVLDMKENTDLVQIRPAFGGKLATTRPLVEKGWNDVTKQIGLSGRTVKPKLIITCGVSGAVQFAAGMDGAECIVAINTDAEAPIFKIANYCITEDLYRVVPALTAAVRAKQQ